jgi:hypothetical protein
MTDAEHKLVVYMFAQQNIRFRALLEILKSRGVVDSGDFDAFEHLAVATMQDDNFLATIAQYTEFAKLLGLGDELPQPGPY